MTNTTIRQATSEQPDAATKQYRAELERLGYSGWTVRTRVHVAQRLLRLMDAEGIAAGDLTPGRAAEIIRKAATPPGSLCRHAVMAAKHFADYLAGVGMTKRTVPPNPAREALRRDYEDYLRRQRGVSEATIYNCWRVADRFLDFRFGEAAPAFADISPGDVAAFLQKLTASRTPYRHKTASSRLRSLLQYLFRAGKTPTNLSPSVPSVAQRWGQRLPRHLSPEQVEEVLAAVRAVPRLGRRNHAMALLQARLGLRAPEVVAIRLEDVDWRAGELLVRGKGGRHDKVPLPQDVGEAIAGYVRHDRASASRVLFVTDRAPHRPFKSSEVLNTILRDAFGRAGVKPPCPYVGSHVLRHSLAVHLVRGGASLAEVADVLRHRSRASTLIYARLDVERLRAVAQPWPAEGGTP